MSQPKLIIPGGSGFLGRTLAQYFLAQGWRVVILSRSPTPIPGCEIFTWDAKTIGPWSQELEGAQAVINLAGRSVNCRYSATNQRAMMESRTLSTLILGQAIAQCQTPPPVWLNSSTATIYRHRFDEANTEEQGLYGPSKEAKDAYSLEVAHAWEDAFAETYRENELTKTRGIILRTAMVFGNEPGGVYETLRHLTQRGLGGPMGHGRQYVSWIHATDFCRALSWLIEKPEAQGIYNLTAPNPLPNREMMATLRNVLSVKIGLPAPRPLLEIGAFFLRTETELIIKSRRVEPARLLQEGFQFEHSNFPTAIQALESESL